MRNQQKRFMKTTKYTNPLGKMIGALLGVLSLKALTQESKSGSAEEGARWMNSGTSEGGPGRRYRTQWYEPNGELSCLWVDEDDFGRVIVTLETECRRQVIGFDNMNTLAALVGALDRAISKSL